MTVIEFWATWCGPCIDQFPHLSEVAEKYQASVDVIAVNVWDTKDGEKSARNRNRQKRIAQFLKAHQKDMRFPVALDSAAETVTKAWMNSAERSTIPTTFVIDREGTIAWIGHPENLDDVLPRVLARDWDTQQAAREYQKVVVERKAAKERDEKTARAILLSAKAKDPDEFESSTKALGYGPNTNIRLGLEMVVAEAPDFVASFLERAMWDDKRFDSITVCKLGMLIVKASQTSRGLDICRSAVAHPDADPELVCYSHCYLAQALHLAAQQKEANRELEKVRQLAKTLPAEAQRNVLDYIKSMLQSWKTPERHKA